MIDTCCFSCYPEAKRKTRANHEFLGSWCSKECCNPIAFSYCCVSTREKRVHSSLTYFISLYNFFLTRVVPPRNTLRSGREAKGLSSWWATVYAAPAVHVGVCSLNEAESAMQCNPTDLYAPLSIYCRDDGVRSLHRCKKLGSQHHGTKWLYKSS